MLCQVRPSQVIIGNVSTYKVRLTLFSPNYVKLWQDMRGYVKLDPANPV